VDGAGGGGGVRVGGGTVSGCLGPGAAGAGAAGCAGKARPVPGAVCTGTKSAAKVNCGMNKTKANTIYTKPHHALPGLATLS